VDKRYVVGFSVNPEVVAEFDTNMGDEKLPLLDFRVDLSGSSADVAIALRNMGRSPLLIGVVGAKEGDEDLLLRAALKRSAVPFHGLNLLDRTSMALLPVDRSGKSRVVGRRGNVLPELMSEAESSAASCVADPETFRIATGVRSCEARLVHAMFRGSAPGYRVLNPNIALCKEKEVFLRLLRETDMLVVNEHEHQEMGMPHPSELHDFGVATVLVTRAIRGGYCSHQGVGVHYDAVVYPDAKTYLPGAGDWFLGGLLSTFDGALNDASPAFMKEALCFAATVAGKKVTMSGAGNGPTKTTL